MRSGEGAMGKLIVLRQVRERNAREALAGAAEAEARARAAEADLEARRRQAQERREHLKQEAGGEQPRAQVLQFRSRFERTLRSIEMSAGILLAQKRGDRIRAEEATARARATLAAARRAREQIEERLEEARLARRRRRERAEEEEHGERGGPER
jgi:hypothetical protein